MSDILNEKPKLTAYNFWNKENNTTKNDVIVADAVRDGIIREKIPYKPYMNKISKNMPHNWIGETDMPKKNGNIIFIVLTNVPVMICVATNENIAVTNGMIKSDELAPFLISKYWTNAKTNGIQIKSSPIIEFPNTVEDLTEFAYTTNKHIGIRPLIILLIISWLDKNFGNL